MAPTGKFYLWPGCPAWIKCRFVLLWLKKFNSSTAKGIPNKSSIPYAGEVYCAIDVCVPLVGKCFPTLYFRSLTSTGLVFITSKNCMNFRMFRRKLWCFRWDSNSWNICTLPLLWKFCCTHKTHTLVFCMQEKHWWNNVLQSDFKHCFNILLL